MTLDNSGNITISGYLRAKIYTIAVTNRNLTLSRVPLQWTSAWFDRGKGVGVGGLPCAARWH